MDVLSASITRRVPVKMLSDDSTSVVALVPAKRSADSLCFGLDDQRYLRISKAGRTDINGARNGPWTEFKAHEIESGSLQLEAMKASMWLDVVGGEFVSSGEPKALRIESSEFVEHEDRNRACSSPYPVGSGVEEVLCMADGSARLHWPVVLRQEGNSGYMFLCTQAGNVACNPQGCFHNKGATGKWARWHLEQHSGGASFKNVGHGRYLSVGADGHALLSDTPALFRVGKMPPGVVQEMPPVDRTVLSDADIKHFKERGYVIVQDAILPELVRDALRCINHQLGKPDCWEADMNPLNAAQLALKLPQHGVGRDLFNKSPKFWSAVNILLGEGNVKPWSSGQQVALRFPQPPEVGHDNPDTKKGTQYHIDGMAQNKLCPFSLLCGVALSDQTRPNMGNLHVFPGSHMHEGLRNYYAQKIDDDNQGEADEGKPNLGASEQVLLKPGDVVLAHQLLAHRVGMNTSEHIRYQLYYRVKHNEHADLKDQIIRDPWVEFSSLLKA